MTRLIGLLYCVLSIPAWATTTVFRMNESSRDWAPPGINRAVTATATISPVVTTSSVVIATPNSNRKGFFIWNNSANSAYISFNPTSSSATPTLILPSFTQFQMTTGVVWTGYISAIRNAGTGTLTFWELQ